MYLHTLIQHECQSWQSQEHRISGDTRTRTSCRTFELNVQVSGGVCRTWYMTFPVTDVQADDLQSAPVRCLTAHASDKLLYGRSAGPRHGMRLMRVHAISPWKDAVHAVVCEATKPSGVNFQMHAFPAVQVVLSFLTEIRMVSPRGVGRWCYNVSHGNHDGYNEHSEKHGGSWSRWSECPLHKKLRSG